MNPDYQQTKFPVVKPLPWRVVFSSVTYENQPIPDNALDLISKFLIFAPKHRLDSFEALTHPYFDELRDSKTRLLDGGNLPPLFNFTPDESLHAQNQNIKNKILPSWYSSDEIKSSENDNDNDNDNNDNDNNNNNDKNFNRVDEKNHDEAQLDNDENNNSTFNNENKNNGNNNTNYRSNTKNHTNKQ